MEKLTFVLDVGSGSTKLLAGYVLDGQPIVVEALSASCPLQLQGGRITDVEKSTEIVKKLLAQMQKSLNIVIDSLVVVMPPQGLEVFQATKTTNILSDQGTISTIDFKNLNTMFRKEKLGEQFEQIGIVPIVFELDEDRQSELPPLGEISNNITLTANVHFVDKALFGDYKAICEGAKVKLRKAVVDAHALAELLAQEDNLRSEYILIDFGAYITTLSFVSEGRVFASTHFETGSSHLTEIIANHFQLPFEEGAALHEHYGFDLRENYFDGIVYQSINDPERQAVVRQSDLNQIIDSFIATWTSEVHRYVATLKEKVGIRIDATIFPWLVVGAGRQLKGFRLLFAKYAKHDRIIYPRFKTIGARSPTFAPALGLLCFINKYAAIHDEPSSAVVSVERLKIVKNKASYNEYEDEL